MFRNVVIIGVDFLLQIRNCQSSRINKLPINNIVCGFAGSIVSSFYGLELNANEGSCYLLSIAGHAIL